MSSHSETGGWEKERRGLLPDDGDFVEDKDLALAIATLSFIFIALADSYLRAGTLRGRKSMRLSCLAASSLGRENSERERHGVSRQPKRPDLRNFKLKLTFCGS